MDSQIKTIKYIDLFCGLGAFHRAFINSDNKFVNYRCVFACDIDDGIRSLYLENYGIYPEGDITKINIDNIPDFNILCAGFPCQPFSRAGKKEGFVDKDRGNLFYCVLDIVKKKKPDQIILENVKNLLYIDNGNTFKTIINELEKQGYNVSYKIINSKHHDCPQSRQRLFIVCDKHKKYVFSNIKNKTVCVSTILSEVDTYFDYSNKYTLQKHQSKHKDGCVMEYILINNKSGKGGRQGERIYSINSCGPTICASSGGPGSKTGLYYINGKIRTLTVTETLRMFGFPIDYKRTNVTDNEMLYYLGNSIVVDVLIDIIRNL